MSLTVALIIQKEETKGPKEQLQTMISRAMSPPPIPHPESKYIDRRDLLMDRVTVPSPHTWTPYPPLAHPFPYPPTTPPPDFQPLPTFLLLLLPRRRRRKTSWLQALLPLPPPPPPGGPPLLGPPPFLPGLGHRRWPRPGRKRGAGGDRATPRSKDEKSGDEEGRKMPKEEGKVD